MTFPRTRSATKTIAAAGDYAANDVLSNSATEGAGTPFEVSAIAPRHGHPFTLTKAEAKCSEDSVTCRLRLHLFNVEPLAAEVEMDDNALFGITTSAGTDKYVGFIDLPAFGDFGAPGFAQATQLDMAVSPANGDTLWIVAQTLDAEANETAGMTLTLTLFSEV